MRLKIGFVRFSPGPLATKAEAIVFALTDNPLIPGPLTPTVAVVKAAAKALRDVMAGVGPGRPAAVEAARGSLAALLTQLGTNLANDPGLSEEALDTSGFDRPKSPTPHVGPPAVPQILRLEDGDHSGTVRAVITAVADADNYSGRLTRDPVKDPAGTVVTPPFPNSQEIVFTGLARKDEVWLSVSANGADGSSDFGPWEGPWLVR